ncbi:Chromosome segregation ATPase OS=Streptomyces glaucescens OX=1907 GN=SGLAU_05625 PE=4 SV=1 [Streptomyces glaucescens]
MLFLENGGGKSVLLKLIFSVMLPGHRNTLGGASSGVLRKFLLADDCGHVALEWQHVQTGECVVVGKVSEWRGRQVSNDPRKFAEAWYSFRPGPGLTLDNLPVAESNAVRPPVEGQSGAQGRRRTMKGFRDALTEAGKAYPHLEVHWEEIHERWTEHLGELGLDPELFRYQREMNADEGEAAGLFAVKKDSDFTDLLLRAVTDTRDTDGLADLVSGFGNKLGRRAELIAERDFTAGSVDLLGRIVESAEARSRARDVHAGAERRTRTLARRLSARGARERVRAADLAQRVTAAAYAVTHAESARERSALITAELAYRHASLALAAAEKAAAAQKRELADARTLHAAWQAAEAVLRHRAAADRVARVAAAIQEAEQDAAPALAARTKAAVDLVRALHAAAESAENLAHEEEERSAALQEVSDSAYRDSTAAATEAQRARSETGHLRQRLTEVEQETAEAVRAGWLDDSAPDADPARAALAASDAEKTAVAAWDTAREAARRAGEHAREAASAESRAELTAARAADAALAAGRAYEGERRTAEALAAEERLAELLSLPGASAGARALVPGPRTGSPEEETARTEGTLTAEELDRFADELRELLDDAVSSAERQLFELRTAAADDARILGALGDGGLLPPGPDVLATVEFLGEHGIPALPGWRYLAQAVDPADHARVLAARPELVDGVIITDPDSHTRAREALSDAALLPRSAVAVGTAAALLAPTPAADSADSGVFLVPPNPAMHDEHAADEERPGAARPGHRARRGDPRPRRPARQGPRAGRPARLLAHRLPRRTPRRTRAAPPRRPARSPRRPRPSWPRSRGHRLRNAQTGARPQYSPRQRSSAPDAEAADSARGGPPSPRRRPGCASAAPVAGQGGRSPMCASAAWADRAVSALPRRPPRSRHDLGPAPTRPSAVAHCTTSCAGAQGGRVRGESSPECPAAGP